MAGVASATSVHGAHGEAEHSDAALLGHLPLDGKGFWIALVFLALGASAIPFALVTELRHGHAVTGEGSHGAIWGIVVANIINFIGVSHVGIAISAVVRLLHLRRYQQLARFAEFITLAAITTAVTNITMDVGHPERFIFNVIWFGRYTAPFVWSATVISTYVFGSSVYLYLAMRRDLWLCRTKVPYREGFYKVLALGYEDSPASRVRQNRNVWWLAVVILPIMVSVHSVYGYIFGLQVGRPGWYNPFQAPYFVLGAIVSGFSTVIVTLAAFRKAFHWEEFFSPRLFKGLGVFLGFVTLLYMYFLASEYLTGMYSSPAPERAVFQDVLFGRFAWVTWSAMLAGMLFPFGLLFLQGVNRKITSIPLTVFAAILINLGLWTIRTVVVVPTFYHPLLPWNVADYVPTYIDWSIVIGSFFEFGLLLLLLVKAFPVLELPEVHDGDDVRVPPMPRWKLAMVSLTAVAGVSLIATGISVRMQPEFYHPPVIWLSGIILLLSVPFQICVLPERRSKAVVDAEPAQ